MPKVSSLGRISHAASAALAGVFFAGAAQAADMPGQYPPLPPPATKPLYDIVDSGWYLRGDLGSTWGLLGSVTSAPGFPDPTNNRLGNAITAGFGAGIKSRWLRTDLTFDYMTPAKYTGTVLTTDDTTAKIGAYTLLFNGYFDLGTWMRLTPYVGAGVGAALLRVSNYTSTGAPPFSGDTANSRINLAFAGTAGIGWTVAPNLIIDFNYRYLNVGDVSTKSDAFGAMTFKNVASHQARVGLRWSFDEFRDLR